MSFAFILLLAASITFSTHRFSSPLHFCLIIDKVVCVIQVSLLLPMHCLLLSITQKGHITNLYSIILPYQHQDLYVQKKNPKKKQKTNCAKLPSSNNTGSYSRGLQHLAQSTGPSSHIIALSTCINLPIPLLSAPITAISDPTTALF